MKHTRSFGLAALLFVAFALPTSAQSYGFFTAGINRGQFNLPNVNRTIYLYNYTRPWLDDQMDYLENAKGFYLGGGNNYDGISLTAGLVWMYGRSQASGIEPTTGFRAHRTIAAGYWGVLTDYGVTVFGNGTHLQIDMGISLSAGLFTLSTRYQNQDLGEDITTTLNNSFYMSSDLYIDIQPYLSKQIGFSIKPYYSLWSTKIRANEIQSELQGANLNDPLLDKPGRYGIRVGILLAGGGRSD